MTERNTAGRARVTLAVVLTAFALVLSACAADEDDGTVTMARATWESGHMQAAIYAQLLGELGYTVSDPAASTLDPNGFYPALASGQYDLWANGWFPIHDIYLEGELVTGQSVDLPIEPVGYQVRSGALQGYLIDKATADAMGITSMSQLSNASVASVFDIDGNGLADLIGCNEGWGCNGVIDSHIAELDWGSSVEQKSGDYNQLIAGVRDRVDAGDPVLFYAWTPNWTYEVLTPGTDVVWLESPAPEDEEASHDGRWPARLRVRPVQPRLGGQQHPRRGQRGLPRRPRRHPPPVGRGVHPPARHRRAERQDGSRRHGLHRRGDRGRRRGLDSGQPGHRRRLAGDRPRLSRDILVPNRVGRPRRVCARRGRPTLGDPPAWGNDWRTTWAISRAWPRAPRSPVPGRRPRRAR